MLLKELNDREKDILKSLIQAHILTAEPVASKILVKSYNLGVSSSTIRNVMSRLEEKGFIRQIHTSSGRVPTDIGYRFYVNHLMKLKRLSKDEEKHIERDYLRKKQEVDAVIQETAKVLAALTECTSMVSIPLLCKDNVRRIKLVCVDEKRVMVIALFENGMVREQLIFLEVPEEDKDLLVLSTIVTRTLQGEDVEVDDQIGLKSLVKEISELDILEVQDDLVIGGRRNLAAFPEFCNYERLSHLMNMLDEKTELIHLLKDSLRQDEVNIYIGEDSKGLADYSIITANYRMGSRLAGSLGVIGPKRMRYAQVVSVVEGVAMSLSRCLSQSVRS